MNKDEQLHFRISSKNKKRLVEIATSYNKTPSQWIEDKIEKARKKKNRGTK